jgi:hypothetical protein
MKVVCCNPTHGCRCLEVSDHNNIPSLVEEVPATEQLFLTDPDYSSVAIVISRKANLEVIREDLIGLTNKIQKELDTNLIDCLEKVQSSDF